MIKVSIITVCQNSEKYIKSAIESVINQTYYDIEYIIIDGSSNDNTLSIIREYECLFNDRLHWKSELDKGIYDAMNKGIKLATGDIVGILNSDDFFTSDDVIEKIVSIFETNTVDAVYGDVCFVDPKNLNKIVRYYSSKWFRSSLFRFGFMPAHPSFYVRRKWFKELGLYKTDYKIAADYELLIRYLYKSSLKLSYFNFCIVTMRIGGYSTRSMKSNWILNKEIVRGCKENHIYTNMMILSLKYIFKITGYIFPKRNK